MPHNQLIIFRENILDLMPKSVCAVEMTMHVHWTCINTKPPECVDIISRTS